MQSRQETVQYWDEHIHAYTASGLTRAAYCDREGLSLKQLIYQKRKRSPKSRKPTPVPSSGFTAVTLASPATGLSLALPSGIQLNGIDASNLAVAKHLLAVLS